MKIPNIFVASIVIATSQILNMSLSSGQTSNFSCENLSRNGLDRNSSDCLQNQLTNNTKHLNDFTNYPSISKAGIVTGNVRGDKRVDFIKDIGLYKNGIKSTIVDVDGSIFGYMTFIAKSGWVESNFTFLNIERVDFKTKNENSRYHIKGSCKVSHLGRPGAFIRFSSPDKVTSKIISSYATDRVDCKALDKKGNQLAIIGLIIVEY